MLLCVSAIQDKKEQARLTALCGAPFRSRDFCYAVTSGGALAGICQFAIDGGVGTVHDLCTAPKAADDDALFLVARQSLNFIDQCGTHRAAFCGDATDALLQRIGFRQTDGGDWKMDLTDFFLEPCQHGKT